MLDHSESSIDYVGEGTTRFFPVTFPFLETSHLAVERTSADGTVTRLTQGVDYLATRHADGTGELELLYKLPVGQGLHIWRDTPLTQEILFHNQGPNSPAAIEEGLDKLTMIAQQQRIELEQLGGRVANLDVSKHMVAPDPHPQYASKTSVNNLFPAAPQAYFIDPAGDTSPATPGTAAAPFKSLRTALDILAGRQAFSAFDLYFYINPGTYPSENLTLTLPLLTSGNLSINAADPANKPVLQAAGLNCHGNQAVYLNNLDLRLSGSLGAHRGCHMHTSGVDIALTLPGLIAAYAESDAFLHMGGQWTLDGGGHTQASLFYAERHSLIYLLPGSQLSLINLPALVRAAVADDFSTINTVGTIQFPAGITGRRYEAYYRSYIRTYGAGEYYFPGDTAGYAQTEAYASYY